MKPTNPIGAPKVSSDLSWARSKFASSLLARAEKAEQERDQALLRITQLKAAQRPRPMDEAPKFVEILALESVIVTDRGTNVLDGDYKGWLPLPDQDE